MSRCAVFLDRDGVLNEPVIRDAKPYPPADESGVVLTPGVRAALERLKAAGYRLIVVTNQPDVGRGVTPIAAVDRIHLRLKRELPLDEILACYHDDGDGCFCRKPRPGLIEQAARQFGIDLAQSFLIGDRWRDIDAGAAAGCRTVLLERGYRERLPDHEPDARVTSIGEAAEWIIHASSMPPLSLDKNRT